MQVESRQRTQRSEASLRRLQVGLAFFAFILIGATDGSTGVLLPSLGNFYSLNKGTVSYIFLAGAAGYLIAAFSSGPLAHKFGQHTLLVSGAGILMTGALVATLTPPFPLLLGGWLLMGFGIATLDAGLNSYIASLPRNAALLNYLHAFYGIGALIGPAVASTVVIALTWQWNLVYLIWVAFAGLVMITLYFLFKQPDGSHDAAPSDTAAQSAGSVLWTALRMRIVWMGAIFLIFYVGSEVSLGNWGYTFLTEDRKQAELLSGWAVSGYWMGLTLGRLTLAQLAQRVGERRLIQGCLGGVFVGVLLVWLVPIGPVAIAGLWLVGFSLGPIFPSTIALVSKIVPGPFLASAIGFMASMGSLGAAFLPWVAGLLAQGNGIWTLLPYVMGLSVLMILVWVSLPKQAKPEPRPAQ